MFVKFGGFVRQVWGESGLRSLKECVLDSFLFFSKSTSDELMFLNLYKESSLKGVKGDCDQLFDQLGLIVTSNHSPKDAAERMVLDASNAGAVESRLRSGRVLELVGDDRREGSR